MKKLISALVFMILVVQNMPARLSEQNTAMLDSLEVAIAQLPVRRQARADDMQRLRRQRRNLSPSAERIALGEQLGRAYVAHDLDSAALFYSLAAADAVTVDNEKAALRMHLRLLAIMPSLGITREAVADFENIDYDCLPEDMRYYYWLSALEIYDGNLRNYPDGKYKDEYFGLTLEALDSLARYYPRESAMHAYLMGHRYLLTGDDNIAVAHFVEAYPVLEQENPELADFAIRAITEYYGSRPHYRQLYLNYLMRRVITLFKRGIMRPASTATLGRELFAEGYEDIGRGLIGMALHTPDRSYASVIEPLEASEFSHFITDETIKVRRVGVVWVLIFAIAFVIATYLLVNRYIRVKRLEQENAELNARILNITDESRRTNQNLVLLAFTALEQLNDYNVHVMRKLKANQIKDLYADVEGGKFIHRLSEKYFDNFDSTFLTTFPNFFSRLNDLFVPDRRIPLPVGDHLTPEQRIAAFMRLGVTDSQRLAQVLGLSLNTIYTYRNRLRGRALDRDTIEADIAEI